MHHHSSSSSSSSLLSSSHLLVPCLLPTASCPSGVSLALSQTFSFSLGLHFEMSRICSPRAARLLLTGSTSLPKVGGQISPAPHVDTRPFGPPLPFPCLPGAKPSLYPIPFLPRRSSKPPRCLPLPRPDALRKPVESNMVLYKPRAAETRFHPRTAPADVRGKRFNSASGAAVNLPKASRFSVVGDYARRMLILIGIILLMSIVSLAGAATLAFVTFLAKSSVRFFMSLTVQGMVDRFDALPLSSLLDGFFDDMAESQANSFLDLISDFL